MSDDLLDVLKYAVPCWADEHQRRLQGQIDYDYEVLRCARERVPIEEGRGYYDSRLFTFQHLFRSDLIVSAPWNGRTAYELSENGQRLYELLVAREIKRRLLR